MNMMGVVLATLGAFVAYFVVGGVMFVAMPWMKTEFMKYPAVYRPSEGQMKNMPVAMVATLVAIVVLAVLYAIDLSRRIGSGRRCAVRGVDRRVRDWDVHGAQLRELEYRLEADGRAVGGVLYSMGGGGDCDWVDLSAGTLSVRTRRFTSRGGGRRRRFGRRLGVRGFRRVTGAARGGRLVELGAQFAVR